MSQAIKQEFSFDSALQVVEISADFGDAVLRFSTFDNDVRQCFGQRCDAGVESSNFIHKKIEFEVAGWLTRLRLQEGEDLPHQ